MPQIADFSDALALMDTSDVAPIEVWRWSGGTIDRGVPSGGAYAQVAFPGPYTVLPGAGPAVRELRTDGDRIRDAIAVLSGRALQFEGDRPDRVLYDGRWWRCVRVKNDWLDVAGYHASVCDLVDEPTDQPA